MAYTPTSHSADAAAGQGEQSSPSNAWVPPRLVSGGSDSLVRVWRAESRGGGFACTATLVGHAAPVTALVVVEGFAFSASGDETVRLWNVDGVRYRRAVAVIPRTAPPNFPILKARCTTVLRNNGLKGTSLALCGGHLVVGSEGGTIASFDARDWAASGTVPKAHGGLAVHALAPVGATGRVLSGGGDGTVGLWSFPDGALLSRFSGHRGPVLSVAVMGNIALSAGDDLGVLPWDLSSGAARTALVCHVGAVTSLVVDRVLGVMSASEDGAVVHWAPRMEYDQDGMAPGAGTTDPEGFEATLREIAEDVRPDQSGVSRRARGPG